MRDKKFGPGDYVREVTENTRQYILDLQGENGRLRRLIAEAEVEHERFVERYVTLERENMNLANLYVASYRLNEVTDTQGFLDVLQEIIVNLVGCEEHAVFEATEGGAGMKLVRSMGIDASRYEFIARGDGELGATLATGELFLRPGDVNNTVLPPGTLSACVPLRLGSVVVGVIALFRLLPQKSQYEAHDRELFSLLGAHAARAWYCTQRLPQHDLVHQNPAAV